MEAEGLLGLPLPVTVAFVALLFGLALVARQLHKLHKPAVVRRGSGDAAAHRPPNRNATH
ncbi:MAG: hypothetical protein V7631_1942 [Massilia sp.]|jgi:hypothetical protein